jgi:hypothetical protein
MCDVPLLKQSLVQLQPHTHYAFFVAPPFRAYSGHSCERLCGTETVGWHNNPARPHYGRMEL